MSAGMSAGLKSFAAAAARAARCMRSVAAKPLRYRPSSDLGCKWNACLTNYFYKIAIL